MKVLVLGVNGMAGHMIGLYLKEKGNEVIGFARSESPICETILGNALNTEDLKRALSFSEFDVVINGIGLLNKVVDQNIADGIFLNSYLPHYIAELLRDKPTRLVHISTDCVFTGNTGNYTETCMQDETSLYGRTKALGEINDNKNLTIRTSIIGPELKDGIGLFHWFMKQEGSVNGYANVLWTGVTTLQLAMEIENMALKNITGIYHLVNNSDISKYELLSLFNKYFKEDKIHIRKDCDIISKKTLINTRSDYYNRIPSYEDMISELAAWVRQHSWLYTSNVKK